MSAREWFICPFCKSDMQTAKSEYGKIPVEKFIEKYKDSVFSGYGYDSEPDTEETVRMDGEEWLGDEGNYHIEHGLHCNNCDREWSIKVSVKPTIDKPAYRNPLVFKVASKSGGDDHEVTVHEGKYTCDCIGFKTRKKCSHITKIKERIEEVRA